MTSRFLHSGITKKEREAKVEVCREVAKFFKKVGIDIQFEENLKTDSKAWVAPNYIQDDFVGSLIGAIDDVWEKTLMEAVPKATKEVIARLEKKEAKYSDEEVRHLIWRLFTEKSNEKL